MSFRPRTEQVTTDCGAADYVGGFLKSHGYPASAADTVKAVLASTQAIHRFEEQLFYLHPREIFSAPAVTSIL